MLKIFAQIMANFSALGMRSHAVRLWSQWPKYLSKKWPKCLIEEKTVLYKCYVHKIYRWRLPWG